MPPNKEWTREQEKALVEELRKRKFLHITWVPRSADATPCFGPAVDDDGQHKFGKEFLKSMSEAVFGRERARDPDAVRCKLASMYRAYFKELKILEAEKLVLPVDQREERYQLRLRRLVVERPWWQAMDAIMTGLRTAIEVTTPALTSPPTRSTSDPTAKTENADDMPGCIPLGHRAAGLSGLTVASFKPHPKEKVSTLRAQVETLQLQNYQLEMSLKLSEKDVEIQKKDVEIQKKDVEIQKKDVEIQTKQVEILTLREKLRTHEANGQVNAQHDPNRQSDVAESATPPATRAETRARPRSVVVPVHDDKDSDMLDLSSDEGEDELDWTIWDL